MAKGFLGTLCKQARYNNGGHLSRWFAGARLTRNTVLVIAVAGMMAEALFFESIKALAVYSVALLPYQMAKPNSSPWLSLQIHYTKSETKNEYVFKCSLA